jgi:hypothetical protein
VDRNEVEELIMNAAKAAGLDAKTIRIGDTSVIMGVGVGSERADDDEEAKDADKDKDKDKDEDEDNIPSAVEDALNQEGPFEPRAYLKALEGAAFRSACHYANLGSRATRAIAQRSLGDVLDHAILRGAVEHYENERILHAALAHELDLLDPPATPREMLRPITLDQVLGMVARQRARHKEAS